MTSWEIEWHVKRRPALKNPILIEGLPGIANVGKIAVDFLAQELKAKRLASFYSNSFPHSVFINEENLVEVPKIELWYKRYNGKNGKKKRDVLIGRIKQNIKLCKKYKVDVVISSFAKDVYGLRCEKELEFLG